MVYDCQLSTLSGEHKWEDGQVFFKGFVPIPDTRNWRN